MQNNLESKKIAESKNKVQELQLIFRKISKAAPKNPIIVPERVWKNSYKNS